MSWKRLATFAAGGAAAVVGAVVMDPGAAATALIGGGLTLLGWATRWPGDEPKRKLLDDSAITRSERRTPTPR